ncbi:hypothetical protein KKB44_05855 [Candidatus Micrarchaeota archaeon]|nr:hypothetical protein [Candidatus Micrarchaeota archaeon]
MRSTGKKFGKQRSKPAELGTERQRTKFSAPHVIKTCGNRRTQNRSKDASLDGPQNENFVLLDVKPTTQNPKPKTSLLIGPIFSLWFSVSGFEFS